MPFTFRKRIPILPFLRLNLSKSGHSWTWHLGPWSYNTRSRRQSVDLPGPINYQSPRRRRTPRPDDTVMETPALTSTPPPAPPSERDRT